MRCRSGPTSSTSSGRRPPMTTIAR
jgi:hypothetical protein